MADDTATDRHVDAREGSTAEALDRIELARQHAEEVHVRAAQTHERAAQLHDRAAEVFATLGDAVSAERERTRALSSQAGARLEHAAAEKARRERTPHPA